jgi:ATP-dependent protease HslVU (ClpYQ) peptidase subunit
MTVIAAAITPDDGVVMAADRLITTGWEKQYHSTPKLWTADTWAVGACGCLRTAQVVKHHVTWPKYRPDEDTDFEAFLVKTLVPAVRAGVDGHGVLKDDSGIKTIPTSFLVATGDHLAAIGENGAVLSESSGRMAIGSGYAEALGRLGSEGPWTEADVITAVRRAIRSARGCGGQITVTDTRTLEIRTVNV